MLVKTKLDRIIKFMEWKAKRFSNNGTYFNENKYFNELDKMNLSLLKDFEIELLYSKLVSNFNYYCRNIGGAIIGKLTCPFCIYFNSCLSCSYGKNHGICSCRNSDYQQFTELFLNKSNKYLDEKKSFNSLFDDIIKPSMK